MAKVVVVDDEQSIVQMVAQALRAEGHEVVALTDGQAALEALHTHHPDLVITDLNLERSRVQGLDVLLAARRLQPPAMVIMITAFGTVQSAVAAMKQGAYDYLEKPFKLDELLLSVERALAYHSTLNENRYLRRQLQDKYQVNRIIGTSPPMQEVFRMIDRVADTDSTVLILGESGTGKELVARALHYNSRRAFAPFIPVNCSALPENLLESELFGHCKGAFTGALTDKRGLFQEAEGGTIFLDEIGCMPAVLQSRLLRVLQEKEVRRVGDNTPIRIDVRVLAATNADLEAMVREGAFREDLYYRLNVIPIRLPSLRERREDIPLLVSHFLRKWVDRQTGQPIRIESREVKQALCAYDWPGNVRELENVIERACIMCNGRTIELADLPPALHPFAQTSTPVAESWCRQPEPEVHPTPMETAGPSVQQQAEPMPPPAAVPPSTEVGAGPARPSGALDIGQPAGARVGPVGMPLKDFLREQEQAYLRRALEQTGGDKEKAAKLLNISLATLYRKLGSEPTSTS